MPDLISREELLAEMQSVWPDADMLISSIDPKLLVRAAPAIDAVPVVRGQPVKIYNDPWTGKLFTTCSVCDGKISAKDKWCKHCGAKMDGGEENDE